jgi:hypothetical protein
MRKELILLLLIGLLLGVGKAWHLTKDGFQFRRALFPLIAQDAPANSDEIAPFLRQSFYYIGRGHQFYAFESADGKYVLKLPRYDRYCLPLWRRALSLPWFLTREEVHRDLTHRLHFLKNSLNLALSELKEETALIGVYFTQRNDSLPPVTLFDRWGRRYLFQPDRYGFVLQKKEPLLIPAWHTALANGQAEEAKRIFDSFLDFIAARARKGISNKDPSFIRNYAFDGQRAIQIDTGSFYYEKESWVDSMNQTLGPFRLWLEEAHPDWITYLDHQVQTIQTDAN